MYCVCICAALPVLCTAVVSVSSLAHSRFTVQIASGAVANRIAVFAESGSSPSGTGVTGAVPRPGIVGGELCTLCRDFPLRPQTAG